METSKKLTHEEFTLRAIEKLAKEGRVNIHTVYSGFNDAFREYFPGANPVDAVKTLFAEGKISFRPAKRGAVIGKPGAIVFVSGTDSLNKMGLS